MEAKVRDLMTPGAIGVDYHQSIGEAARTMRDWGVGSVLVVSDRTLSQRAAGEVTAAVPD
jgi:predicted transcriptional regulator